MKVTTLKDNASYWHRDSILMSHRNINSRVFDAALAQQQLTDYKNELYGPLANNTFGLMMYGNGLYASGVTSGRYANSSYKLWNLRSRQARTSFNLLLVAHANQTATYSEWEQELLAINASTSTNAPSQTFHWWHSFWNRSYIFVNSDARDI
jgi:hypothetical protein